jgi:PadR family transcriptional regulator, regulatory protein PadR
MTARVAKVVRIFLDDRDTPVYGFELVRRTGFPSGSIYPMLARLERARWITSQRESDEDAWTAGHPPRRLYQLTAEGAVAAQVALADLTAQLQPGASRA